MSELFHKNIASTLGWESILASEGRAPSLLNGGLSQAWVSGVLFFSIALAGYHESQSMNDGTVFWGAEKPANYRPGSLGFDPLGLGKTRKDMATAEIKNGRLAMLAVTFYAFRWVCLRCLAAPRRCPCLSRLTFLSSLPPVFPLPPLSASLPPRSPSPS